MNNVSTRKSTYQGREAYYVEDLSHRFVCQNNTLSSNEVTIQIGMLVCGYHPGFDTNIAVSKPLTVDKEETYRLCLTSRASLQIDYLQQAKDMVRQGCELRKQWQYINRGLELLIPNIDRSTEISHAIMTSLKLAVAMHFSTNECLFDVIDSSHLFDLFLEKMYQPKRNIHDTASRFFDLSMQSP